MHTVLCWLNTTIRHVSVHYEASDLLRGAQGRRPGAVLPANGANASGATAAIPIPCLSLTPVPSLCRTRNNTPFAMHASGFAFTLTFLNCVTMTMTNRRYFSGVSPCWYRCLQAANDSRDHRAVWTQIRVHLGHVGHPIIGDEFYGVCGEWIPRQVPPIPPPPLRLQARRPQAQCMAASHAACHAFDTRWHVI